MRRLAIGFALLLSGCDTSMHDLLYFPGLGGEKTASSEAAPPSTEASAPPTTSAGQPAEEASAPRAEPPRVASNPPAPIEPTARAEAPHVASSEPAPVESAPRPLHTEPAIVSSVPAPLNTVPQQATSPTGAITAHCQAVADQRTSDAALNGLDEDLQQAIHDRTYSDCVAWQTKHGGSFAPPG